MLNIIPVFAGNVKKLLKNLSGSDSNGEFFAVGVAQSVEHQVVALVVAGSSPVTHPISPSSFTISRH
jgi:hypothetical protein